MKNNILIKLSALLSISFASTYVYAFECPETATDNTLGQRSLSSVVIFNSGSGSGHIKCLYGNSITLPKTSLNYDMHNYLIESPGNWNGYPGGQECTSSNPKECQFMQE